MDFTMKMYLKQNLEDSGMQFNTWFIDVSLTENQSRKMPRLFSKTGEMYEVALKNSKKQINVWKV